MKGPKPSPLCPGDPRNRLRQGRSRPHRQRRGLAYALFGQKKYDQAEPLYQRLIGLWAKSVGDDHPMVAIALDRVAVFYADQKKFDQSKEATERATAIRTHFLAAGLSTAATQELAENNKSDALALYRRAILVMDPPHPIYQEMHDQIEEIIKDQEAPPPRSLPGAHPRKRNRFAVHHGTTAVIRFTLRRPLGSIATTAMLLLPSSTPPASL